MKPSRFVPFAATVVALAAAPALSSAQTVHGASPRTGSKAEWLRTHPNAPRALPRTAANDDWKQAWQAAHPNHEYAAAATSSVRHAARPTPQPAPSNAHPTFDPAQRRGGGPASTYDFSTGYDYDTLNHGASNDLNRSTTSPGPSMNRGNTGSMESDTGASGTLVTGGGMR